MIRLFMAELNTNPSSHMQSDLWSKTLLINIEIGTTGVVGVVATIPGDVVPQLLGPASRGQLEESGNAG